MSETPHPKQGPKEVGKSKGGSSMLQYGEKQSPQFGITEESTLVYTEQREKVYQEIFGEIDLVYHEIQPMVPHIDVYRFAPTEGRPFFSYVTGGLSDIPMNTPDAAGPEYRRAEMVFYAEKEDQEYAELLRTLAHFPHDNNTWLHWGHTMPNGVPAEPIFGTKRLDTFVFMPSILEKDCDLGTLLQIEGDPVHLIWCDLITTAECNYKLDKGMDALYELFNQHDHPVVFAGDRESYA